MNYKKLLVLAFVAYTHAFPSHLPIKKKGPKPAVSYPLIHELVVMRNHAALEQCLFAGVLDVTEKDSKGNTALHCAAADNNSIAVAILMRHGASPLAVNHQGTRPLDMGIALNCAVPGALPSALLAFIATSSPAVQRNALMQLNGHQLFQQRRNLRNVQNRSAATTRVVSSVGNGLVPGATPLPIMHAHSSVPYVGNNARAIPRQDSNSFQNRPDAKKKIAAKL